MYHLTQLPFFLQMIKDYQSKQDTSLVTNHFESQEAEIQLFP